jgi:hypothetical protein
MKKRLNKKKVIMKKFNKKLKSLNKRPIKRVIIMIKNMKFN